MGKNLRPIDIFHLLKRNNALPRAIQTYAHFRRYWKLNFWVPPPEFYNKEFLKECPDGDKPIYKGNAGKKEFIAELVVLRFMENVERGTTVDEIRELVDFPRREWGIGVEVPKR